MRLKIVVFVLVLSLFIAGCSTGEATHLSCQGPQDCDAGELCIRGVCAGEFVCGDVDGNRIVNKGDAQRLANYLIGKGNVDPARADVNGDGFTNIQDVLIVIRESDNPTGNCG